LLKVQIERFSTVDDFLTFVGPYKGLLSPIGKGIGLGNGNGKEERGAGGRNKNATATREEVDAFMAELSLPPSDAEWFFNKCVANGWTNKGEPIKDWRATIRSWKAVNYLPSQKQQQNGPRKTTADREFERTGFKGDNIPLKII
jgi:hypothetical protein